MRVMVVDDELLCLEDTVYMLSRYDDVEIVGAFTKPQEALEATRELKPDAMFLDLFMPHLSGAELAKEVLALFPNTKLIFVTAFAKELAQVNDLPIFDRLLKPLDDACLQQVLDRLRVRPPL